MFAIIPFPDGSSLCSGNDLYPHYRSLLILLGVPVAKMEIEAAGYNLPVALVQIAPIGWAVLHHGFAPASENGWSWLLADRPESLASQEALAALERLKAETMAVALTGDSPSKGFAE